MYDFGPLRKVLRRCANAEMQVPLWWRDDDTIEASTALDELLSLSDSLGVAVHLAVIPAHVNRSLAARLKDTDTFVMVHGWAHENLAPVGHKKAEFGEWNPDASQKIKTGRARLDDLFADRFLPIFVPPWNRMDQKFTTDLVNLGFDAVSAFGPRGGDLPERLAQVNTHVDPIFWKGNRNLVDPDMLVQSTVRLLEDRLQGHTDAAEPLGYLTHHLVHTDAIWNFSKAWLTEMLEGGAHPITLKGVWQ